MSGTPNLKSNIPLFIAFRVLFNARWYYPVLAVLFIDFGLTIEQYALLNVAWAAAIVGLEVPSGALADQLGRKRMVVFAAALMVVEMTLFAFAPRGASWLMPRPVSTPAGPTRYYDVWHATAWRLTFLTAPVTPVLLLESAL